jgi:hypothetical protein
MSYIPDRRCLILLVPFLARTAPAIQFQAVVSAGSSFRQRGFSLVQANLVVSLIGWTLIPAIPLASAVAERFGRPGLAMLASQS